MNRIKSILFMLSLFSIFLIPTAFALTNDHCIPAGGSSNVTEPRPPLQQNGVPANAQWQGGTGNPQATEDDSTSPDDPMGSATPSSDGSSATATVSNSDPSGDLSGSNGQTQNGGAEGDCIEVKICWTYWYTVTSGGWTITIRDKSGTIEITIPGTTVIKTGRHCSGTTEKCPC